jgi:hypothetical protein
MRVNQLPGSAERVDLQVFFEEAVDGIFDPLPKAGK